MQRLASSMSARSHHCSNSLGMAQVIAPIGSPARPGATASAQQDWHMEILIPPGRCLDHFPETAALLQRGAKRTTFQEFGSCETRQRSGPMCGMPWPLRSGDLVNLLVFKPAQTCGSNRIKMGEATALSATWGSTADECACQWKRQRCPMSPRNECWWSWWLWRWWSWLCGDCSDGLCKDGLCYKTPQGKHLSEISLLHLLLLQRLPLNDLRQRRTLASRRCKMLKISKSASLLLNPQLAHLKFTHLVLGIWCLGAMISYELQ